MTDSYFIYYAASSALCVVIFGIMLAHNHFNVDRQEKQIKYDQALIMFMLYFISDTIWAGVDTGVLPVNHFTAISTDVANYLIMTGITYTWLNYVMAVEQTPHRNRPINRFAVLFPFIVATIALAVIYIINPSILIDDELKATVTFYAFLVVVPYIYIFAVIIYAVKRARKEENRVEKRKHLYIGFFPLLTVVGGLTQMLWLPTLPIFCYCSTVLMLIFYIQSIEKQISTDPLTGLNNRRQLMRFVSQRSNLHKEGRITFVVMMDINDFKAINDTCGHAEGDASLVIVAQSLEKVIGNSNIPVFIGRYGGDEFVMVAFAQNEEELKLLIAGVRAEIRQKCIDGAKPYTLALGIGYDELSGEQDSFQKCLLRADRKLYLDKEYGKIGRKQAG